MTVLRGACEGGHAHSCRYVARLYRKGLGVKEDWIRAADFFQLACHGGDGYSCSESGDLAEILSWPAWVEAMAFYTLGCELGDLRGCHELAAFYSLRSDRTSGVVPEPAKAERLLRSACAGSLLESCLSLARLLRDGETAASNADEIESLLLDACVKHERGCSELANLYLEGRLARQDFPAAARYLARDCAIFNGAASSCSRLDAGGESAFDERLAARHLGRACEAGQIESCRYLGYLHLRGQGVPPDLAHAGRRLQQACDGGDDYSCAFLGTLYERGLLGEAERAKAVSLYRRAEDPRECRRPCGLWKDGRCKTYLPWEPAVSTIYNDGRFLERDGALQLLSEACDADDPYACRCLADVYALGEGGWRRDDTEAARLRRRACDAGSVHACFLAAERLRGAKRNAADKAESARLFRLACENGIAEACRKLAYQLEISDFEAADEGGVHDIAAAAAQKAEVSRWLRRACEGGDHDGCSELAQRSRSQRASGQENSQHGSTVALLTGACDEEHDRSCIELGILYQYGSGVERDLARAAELYRRACDLVADGLGCYYLGRMYTTGQGVERDDRRAAELMRSSCEGRVPGICGELGLLWLDARGVERDVAEAVRFLHIGCYHDDRIACRELGKLYRRGKRVERDDFRAAFYFDEGCQEGSPTSCWWLAVMHTKGEGVERDLGVAGRLFTKATVMELPHWLQDPLTELEYIESAVTEGRVVRETESSDAEPPGHRSWGQ